jgi:hypothetical protein
METGWRLDGGKREAGGRLEEGWRAVAGGGMEGLFHVPPSYLAKS